MYRKLSAVSKVLFISIAIFLGGHAMAQSTQEQNKAIIGKFAEEVFVKKDLSKLDLYMKKDYIQHNPFVAQGSAGFSGFFEAWFKSAPDFNYTLKKIISDEDHVWVYGTYAGTQAGEWLGIPASNAKYSFDAIDIFRIENGKLAEHWDVMDIYTLFKQLGTIK
jgi:predicted SnoaL-like aldol condensation-catalyzing enzyme